MPNYNGPGKYDLECQRVVDETGASCVVLIVVGGDRGDGFAVTGEGHEIARLPGVLESMAQQIRAQSADA